MCKAIPQCLYHYTSADVLELILKNRTIRFNNLTAVDDPQEKWSAHGTAQGHFHFISSWTQKEEEMPRMWKEYCRPDATTGVRIKMPVNPFSKSENCLEKFLDASTAKIIGIYDSYIFRYYGVVPEDCDEHARLLKKLLTGRPDLRGEIATKVEKIQRTSITCFTSNVDELLIQVGYTKDTSKLYPRIYGMYKGMRFEDFSDYGRYKDTKWEWQQEWRYRLHFRREISEKITQDGNVHLYELPFDYYDLKLDSEKIKSMEITLSPVIRKEAREKVQMIVEKYCPTADIVESSLPAEVFQK